MSRHFRFKGSDLPLSAEKENGKMIPSPPRAEAIIRFSYRKQNVLCIIISPVLVLCFIHPQETGNDPRRGSREEAGRAGESFSESSSHSRRISDPEKVNHGWTSLRAQRALPSEWLRRRQAAKKMLPQKENAAAASRGGCEPGAGVFGR